MATIYEERYAYHPEDVKSYDTEKIRKEFLVENILIPGDVRMVYSHIERYIVGGAVPLSEGLLLEAIEPIKAPFFCERREVGVINVGGSGAVIVDGKEYKLGYKDGLYVGAGSKEVIFKSDDVSNPSFFYFNSAPAHKSYPSKHVTLAGAPKLHLGAKETSNERDINQMMINSVVDTCQLQMGMTELNDGCVWNTMPAHTHSRRNEVYFYFEVPQEQAVCHFMGQPQETRHIWMKNNQAVISPPWSIHSAAGTSNYIFIWGMAGENLDYSDMDIIQPNELK